MVLKDLDVKGEIEQEAGNIMHNQNVNETK